MLTRNQKWFAGVVIGLCVVGVAGGTAMVLMDTEVKTPREHYYDHSGSTVVADHERHIKLCLTLVRSSQCIADENRLQEGAAQLLRVHDTGMANKDLAVATAVDRQKRDLYEDYRRFEETYEGALRK